MLRGESMTYMVNDSDNPTINYYNLNADAFISGTVSADFEAVQKRFLNLIPQGGKILDFGCGSGRDTKYFLEHGYQVDATDGSEEMCRRASEYTGIQVKQMYFSELNAKNMYDGIWACSSILHVPSAELQDIFQRISDALKNNGVLYTSFKYGSFEGERNGRYFTDLDKQSFHRLVSGISELITVEEWITNDVRPERSEEKWLNVIIKKMAQKS